MNCVEFYIMSKQYELDSLTKEITQTAQTIANAAKDLAENASRDSEISYIAGLSNKLSTLQQKRAAVTEAIRLLEEVGKHVEPKVHQHGELIEKHEDGSCDYWVKE